VPGSESAIPLPGQLAEYLENLPFPRAVLFPDSDDWTKAIAELPEHLKDRFPSSISPAFAVDMMIDKWRFAEMLERLDLPRPKTILLTSMDQISHLPEYCFENMFLKPLDSQDFWLRNRTKGFRLRDKQHALEIMSKLDSKGTGAFPILLQEYVPGPASKYYLVDGFVDRHGSMRACIARRRIRMYPPVFGSSSFSETIPLDQVRGAVETLEKLWVDLRYRGIFDAEFKYDERDGQFKVVEVNARPWWYVEFATRCGTNLCHMAYEDALGRPVPPVFTYAVGRRCTHVLFDFLGHRAVDPGFGGFFRWLRSLKGAEDILYCRDDPKPGTAFLVLACRKHLRMHLQSASEAIAGLRKSAPLPKASRAAPLRLPTENRQNF